MLLIGKTNLKKSDGYIAATKDIISFKRLIRLYKIKIRGNWTLLVSLINNDASRTIRKRTFHCESGFVNFVDLSERDNGSS